MLLAQFKNNTTGKVIIAESVAEKSSLYTRVSEYSVYIKDYPDIDGMVYKYPLPAFKPLAISTK